MGLQAVKTWTFCAYQLPLHSLLTPLACLPLVGWLSAPTPLPLRVWMVKAKAVLSLGHHAVISWSLETDCWDNRIIHLSQLIVACNQIWLLSSSIRETVRSSVKAKLKLRWNCLLVRLVSWVHIRKTCRFRGKKLKYTDKTMKLYKPRKGKVSD